MMVVTNGSRDLLQSCCPPRRWLPIFDCIEESQRSKGCRVSLFSKENSRFSGLAGTRISRKNSLKSRHQTYTPCIAGDCTSITRSELGVPLRRSLVATNRKGKWGKHNQVRIERSWVRRHEKGRSWEGHTSGSGSLQYSGKQPGLIEETISLKDDQPLDARGIGEQGSLRLLNQPRREVLEDVISSPEYQKIQDLKFSGDMWEGDSGPQVLDLQVGLYHRLALWLVLRYTRLEYFNCSMLVA